MRAIAIFAGLIISLTGCAATEKQVATSLSQRFTGRSVDGLVMAFGPPESSFKMSDGATAYRWQLANHTNVHGKGGARNTVYCKVQAIAGPNNIVRSVATDDVSNHFGESLCAERLRLKRYSNSHKSQKVSLSGSPRPYDDLLPQNLPIAAMDHV